MGILVSDFEGACCIMSSVIWHQEILYAGIYADDFKGSE